MQLKKGSREGGFQPRTDRYADETGPEMNDEEYPSYDPQAGPTIPPLEGAVGDTAASDVPPSTMTQRSESIIDGNSQFEGRYETERDLRILGRVGGEIICRGLLTIERDASAKAKVSANEAHIKGKMEGDIVCTGRLVIASTAHVSGTLKAPTLVVEEGASLIGSVETVAAGSIIQSTPAPSRATTSTPPPATSETPAPRTSRREIPSFAIVSSDERVSLDRG